MAQAGGHGKNIYFAGSIRGGREDAVLYHKIIAYLAEKHGTVFTEHVGLPTLEAMGESNMSETAIHDRDMGWLVQSQAVVAEVTVPSLGVGYELGRAIEMNIPVLCLFRPSSGRSLSAMIRGAESTEKKFHTVDYNDLSEAQAHIADFFKRLGW
eukprot:comp97836_c0_seq1/m.48683 comp97836_c0_seq1/g.48683  ORF comp97836_c0_seq1/g.48683 comp97836_c0_seq1/m.48683 type:complete len:154 (-) comp97836_c0_seq1:364-825(-)